MIHPPFANSTDYNCLKPDLSGPKAMWEYREAERLLARHQEDARKSKSRYGSPKEIKQIIEDEILDIKQGENGLDIPAKIHFVIGELQNLVAKQKRYGKEHGKLRYRELIGMVKDMYFSFDIEKWKKDFTKAFPSTGLTDEEKAHRKAVRDAEKQRNKMDKDYDWTQHFKAIPHTWRGASRELVGENKLAETICRKFLDDWTDRQANFGYAVTIGGILIESFPDEKKTLWGDAWKQFGLDKIKRAEIFSHILHRQEAAKMPPAPATIPKEFHKAD